MVDESGQPKMTNILVLFFGTPTIKSWSFWSNYSKDLTTANVLDKYRDVLLAASTRLKEVQTNNNPNGLVSCVVCCLHPESKVAWVQQHLVTLRPRDAEKPKPTRDEDTPPPTHRVDNENQSLDLDLNNLDSLAVAETEGARVTSQLATRRLAIQDTPACRKSPAVDPSHGLLPATISQGRFSAYSDRDRHEVGHIRVSRTQSQRVNNDKQGLKEHVAEPESGSASTPMPSQQSSGLQSSVRFPLMGRHDDSTMEDYELEDARGQSCDAQQKEVVDDITRFLTGDPSLREQSPSALSAPSPIARQYQLSPGPLGFIQSQQHTPSHPVYPAADSSQSRAYAQDHHQYTTVDSPLIEKARYSVASPFTRAQQAPTRGAKRDAASTGFMDLTSGTDAFAWTIIARSSPKKRARLDSASAEASATRVRAERWRCGDKKGR